MALGKNTERLQITFNKDKQNDKVILDYLSSCYDRNAKIKELLYSVIVAQGVIPIPTVSNSDERLLTFSNGKQEVETITNDAQPLVTISNNEEQEVKEGIDKEQDLDIEFEIKEVVKKDTNKKNNDDFDINNFMNQIENLNYNSY